MSLQTVITNDGKVQGQDCGSYTLFRGIPYAAPPIGSLRFSPARPMQPYTGILQADSYRPASLQHYQDTKGFYTKEFYSDPKETPSYSEDCLYLNIWSPARSASDNLPVVIWIHGGGFEHGYSYEPEFDGAAYAGKGIVFISIAYRVGVLGYLCHEALAGPDGSMGNFGLSDQLLALRWVHENIAAFGGNPKDITLMGQSAGAAGVQMLCSSPAARGLIQKAILQSGGGYGNPLQLDCSLSFALQVGTEFAALTGAHSRDDFLNLTEQQILKASTTLLQHYAGHGLGLPFLPVTGHPLLPDSCDESLDRNRIADIPYLIGSTADDLGTQDGCKNTGDRGPLQKAALAFAAKRDVFSGQPVYVYYFNHPLPGCHDGYSDGCFHSCELWYTFRTLERCWRPFTEQDRILSRQIHHAWCSFIKYGNPETSKQEKWPPCTSSRPYSHVYR